MAVEIHMLPIRAGDSTLIVDRSGSRPFSVLVDASLAKDEAVAYLQSVGVDVRPKHLRNPHLFQ